MQTIDETTKMIIPIFPRKHNLPKTGNLIPSKRAAIRQIAAQQAGRALKLSQLFRPTNFLFVLITNLHHF